MPRPAAGPAGEKTCWDKPWQLYCFKQKRTGDRPRRLNLLRIEEDLSAAHVRLARVTIECLSYAEVLRRYDARWSG